jgi:ABC-type bacteriocin/lantibiotic exporter with double-glycine peptidase domain
VLVWGILGIKNGNFTYALLLVFLQLVGQLERPFILLKSQYPIFVNSLASADRLIELEKIEDENITDCRFIGSPLGIKLRNVTFNYNNKKHVYTNFSYDFKPASITAIIGETGVGKSTLFRLILSQIYPTRGSVVFYTTDGKEIPVTPNVRCNCTYVPQGNSLLSGTIRYNLKLGNLKASDSDMIAALHSAVADFVINELPDGLDTIIGENGIGLSEGQSQRIAIARGLLKDCNIILLDEPTSALDPNTEALLLKQLTSYYSNKTILIITHKTEICQFISNTLHIERGL